MFSAVKREKKYIKLYSVIMSHLKNPDISVIITVKIKQHNSIP